MPITLHFHTTNTTGQYTDWVGAWLNVPSAPSGDTTLIDYDCGANGFLRVKLTSALHIVAECQLAGNISSLDFGAITTGSWWWFYVQMFDGPNLGGGRVAGGAGNVTTLYAGVAGVSGDFTYTCRFGIGFSLSSAYADFPNTVGWELSKIQLSEATPPAATNGAVPPSADITPGAHDHAFFSCRQTVGAATQLTDSSSNANNLVSVSGLGLNINVLGPYGT